jgi:hypothetical protein
LLRRAAKEKTVRRFLRIPIRSLAIAALCGLSSAAAGAQPASPSAPAVVIGTVCRIDPGAGTLDLLTGVGHAIRIHRVHFASDMKVKGRGAQAGISALVPGVVCRVACRQAAAGTTAYSVELLEPAPARTQ